MTTATAATAPADFSLKDWVRRHPLGVSVALIFAFTWPFMLVDAFGSHGLLPFRLPLPLMLLTGYMPTLAVLLTAGLAEGRAGLGALLKRLFVGRVGLGWYLLSIFGYAGLCLVVVPLHNALGGTPALPWLSAKAAGLSGGALAGNILGLFIVSILINGEELAWRGFVLPRLQARWSALTSSLILGVIWMLFHLPLFFTVGGSSQVDMPFVSFLLSTVALSVLITWVYNHTRGSVLLAMLIHAALNTWTQVFPIDHGTAFTNWVFAGVLSLAAVAVILVYGPEHLARGTRRIQSADQPAA